MFFEDAQFEAEMYNIDPSLTCKCDDVHICQQCIEDESGQAHADDSMNPYE
tara:strand:- start:674 stop:826 length:153 start_codon:yes stop_codon:yes gene_type:complete